VSFSERWLTVRVVHSGSPMAVNGKTGSPHLGEDPRAGDRAREVMVRCGGVASSSLGWQW
jgi:hypothetical protein